MDIEPTLRKFFERGAYWKSKPFVRGYNHWTQQGQVHAYLRLSRRNLSIGLSSQQVATENATHFEVKVLDIANIDVLEESRGKGFFRRWYAEAEELAREQNLGGIYFENVLNPILQSFCERHGFKVVPGSLPVCYFKELAACGKSTLSYLRETTYATTPAAAASECMAPAGINTAYDTIRKLAKPRGLLIRPDGEGWASEDPTKLAAIAMQQAGPEAASFNFDFHGRSDESAKSQCPHCGRDLEDAEELKTGLCTSDDCPRHDHVDKEAG